MYSKATLIREKQEGKILENQQCNEKNPDYFHKLWVSQRDESSILEACKKALVCKDYKIIKLWYAKKYKKQLWEMAISGYNYTNYIKKIYFMEQTIEKRLEWSRDILPDDHKYLTFLKKVFRHEFRKNGFRRISTPFLEETSLLRKVYPENNNSYGLYTFEDKTHTSVALLPSAKVGIMRSYIENETYEGLQPTYYYYMERCFRQSRKRKEFYTIWGEIIGESDPIIDAQNIYMVHTWLDKIGLRDGITLRINSYGNPKELEKYTEELKSFFENKVGIMSESTRELYESGNVFAPFYSRDEDDTILAASAPSIHKFLKKDNKARYETFKMYLDDLGIQYKEDHSFFMSEEYYTSTFWQFDDEDGNVIASGGRYDTLATNLWSVKPYGAAGFSLDVMHMIDALKGRNIAIRNKDQIDLYFVQLGDEAKRVVFPLSLEARAKGINTQTSLGTPSMKEQMLKAQRIGSNYVVLVGLMEARSWVFQVRNIADGTQEEVKKEELIDYIISKIWADQLDFYEPSRDLVQNEAPKVEEA